MTTAFIHLSDFHNVCGKHENHAVLVNALFVDMRKRLELVKADHVYLVFSGDVAQSGDEVGQYEDFHKAFDDRLNQLGIGKNRRIVVPGNHDLCRSKVETNFVEHEAIICQKLNEQKFNDYVLRDSNVFTGKFSNYLDFQKKFAEFGITTEKTTGAGWTLDDDIGIYCLNSAVCSSGGLVQDGRRVEDKGRLTIDTRSLHAWVSDCKARWKILVTHHPLSWLSSESSRELKVILENNFSLCLSGHEHEQSASNSISSGSSFVDCSAPALFTAKSDELGYSIILVDSTQGVRELTYRQWTKYQSFVAGTGLSNTEDGKLSFHAQLLPQLSKPELADQGFVARYLGQKLDQALLSFSGQPTVWLEPILKLQPETPKDQDAQASVELREIIRRPTSRTIKAPPQFGLSSLAHFLAKEAWSSYGSLWIYLDATQLKPHRASITEMVAKELSLIGLAKSEIKCIVLDSVGQVGKDLTKLLAKIKEIYSDLPVIQMETMEPGVIYGRGGNPVEFTDSSTLYLWSLTRSQIRGIVTQYNDFRLIGDEDAVTSKIVADLNVLNLHRTPFNCLTLLKVSEIDFDESPVNRSEMIKRVLFLLFNVDLVPTYKTRPDLKDCEYVLGYFCETMIKENVYIFSRAHFLKVANKCCSERFIDLEVQVVFDVLSVNNILVMRDGQFAFKFSFWVYYFAALRMHHDQAFADFIFEDMRYANFPEIVEFYTGIDRRREDALLVLTRDLKQAREKVDSKCGLPKDLNIFSLAQWNPSPATIEKMQLEMSNGIKESNLPAELKDRFADRGYDALRPYNQRIDILGDSSFVYFRETLRAAAKALRNSDYVDPSIKRLLLQEILRSWEQLSTVLLVVMPILADKGSAAFDGSLFLLDGDFGDSYEERLTRILMEIPANVVTWSEDDLYSQKMGPLLLDVLDAEQSDLRRHELILLLITQRPRDWHSKVQAYIAGIPKNSFYLLDIYRVLRSQYRYSYASLQSLKDIKHLISMAATKHVTGHKEPGVKLIEKTLPRLIGESVIPPREV